MQGALLQKTSSYQVKTFKTIEKTTRRVPQDIIKKRMEKSTYARYGMQYYNIYIYRRKTLVVIIASLQNRFPLFPPPIDQEPNTNNSNEEEEK